MKTFLLLAVCAGTPAFAQFSSMATDYAGQRLLFTTELSQTGAGQPDYGKLFVADWRGVTPMLVYNRAIVQQDTSGLFPGGYMTNFYDVDGVNVSSNGAYLSVMAARECRYSAGLCRFLDQSTFWDTRGQPALTADDRVIVSPNGKWAMGIESPLSGPETRFRLYDLTTGAKYDMSYEVTGNRDWRLHDIADDGTGVVATERAIILYRAPDKIEHLPVDFNGIAGTGARSVVIDAAGRVVVWEYATTQSRSSLYVGHTANLATAVNRAVPGRSDFQPHISDDGTRIAFLSSPTPGDDPQQFVMAIDGTGRRQVTSEPEGIAQSVLSGNGRVAWVLTRTGRLLKIDIDTGARTQYISPLAAFLGPTYYPNTSVRPSVQGSAGQTLSIPASVMPGEKVEVSLQGQTVPILNIAPQSVTIQIPWSAPVSSTDAYTRTALSIRKPDSPEWTGDTVELLLSAAWPTFVAQIHQNFDALITDQSPAHPGEIIHLYGTGFGAVTPAVPDATPGPVSPLSHTARPVACTLGMVPADVLFAGLAPGYIGIYQVDVRLPEKLGSGTFQDLMCTLEGIPDLPARIGVSVRPQ